jgi:uncharacterized protein (TIGR03083 family)
MDFLAAIRRDSARFAELAASADPSRPVPSCPAWTVADLVWHLGEVQWFWATDVALGATSPDQVEAAKPARPANFADLVAWGREQTAFLLRVLESTPDDRRVWTWALDDGDHNVGFVRRHQVQEAALHRWDLDLAVTGAPQPIDAATAADSIDEVLAITLPWGLGPDKPLPGTVHLHATDADGEWLIARDGGVERVHANGDVALQGTASDLLLALYRRAPLESLEVLGDGALAPALVARLNTE